MALNDIKGKKNKQTNKQTEDCNIYHEIFWNGNFDAKNRNSVALRWVVY